MRIYLSTYELEEARGPVCGSCGKDDGFHELMDINHVFSHVLCRLNKCVNCGELTLVLDDPDEDIKLTKPVMVDWDTELTEPLRR